MLNAPPGQSNMSDTDDNPPSILKLLELEELEPGVQQAAPSGQGRDRLFGGELVAQALAAACFSVDGDDCHSLHAHFIRPGKPGRPVQYEVSAMHDARRLCSRQVTAYQREELILHLIASFQADAGRGPVHQQPMPDVPHPRDLPDEATQRAKMLEKIPKAFHEYVGRALPVEMAAVDDTPWFTAESLPARSQVWMRAREEFPDFPNLHRCAIAYCADYTAIHACVKPLPITPLDPRYQLASLDHSVWFHRPARADSWLLYDFECPIVHGGRGLGRGSVYSEQGELIASVAQEAIIHQRDE